MSYNHYLRGELSIPKDKLSEVNDLVLTILDKGASLRYKGSMEVWICEF